MSVDGEGGPVVALAARRAGAVLSRQQRDRVQAAAERLRAGRLEAAWLRWLESAEGARELDELAAAAAVHTTELFRDEVQLEALRRHVLEPLAGEGRPLQLWSAGCSTGEEVATLLALLTSTGAHPDSTVLGTDLSSEVLGRAKALRFSASAAKRVPSAERARCFVEVGGGLALAPGLASRALFARHNLTETPYPFPERGSTFDLIVCRNVLIYLTPEVADAVLARFAERLSERGVLVLAAAEPILDPRQDLEPLRAGEVFFYTRPRRGPRPSAPPLSTSPPGAFSSSRPAEAPAATPRPSAPASSDSGPFTRPGAGAAPATAATPRPSAPASSDSGLFARPGAGGAPRAAATPRPSAPGSADAGHFTRSGSGAGGPAFARPSAPPAARFGEADLRASAPAPLVAFADGQVMPAASAPPPRPLPQDAAGTPPPRPSGPRPGQTPLEEGQELFEHVLSWAHTHRTPQETESMLRNALYLAPGLAAARYVLGLHLEQHGQRAQAQDEFRRALQALESGTHQATPFFLNDERLASACRLALERLDARPPRRSAPSAGPR